MPSEVFETFKSGNTYNIGILSINRIDAINDYNSNELITGILSGSFLICIVATYISMFICSEYKNSYITVAITHGQTRFSMYNQYVMVTTIASIPISMISVLGVFLSLAANKILIIDNITIIMNTLLFQLILIVFCSVCFACVSIMLEKHRAIAICVSSVFLIPLLPGYIQILTKGTMNIESYSLLSILIHSANFDNVEMVKCIIVAVITALTLYSIGLYIFQKRNFE